VPREAQSELRRKLGIGAGPLALYMGHISYGSELSLMIDALLKVIAAVPDLRVVIIGSGEGVEGLREQTQRLGVADHVIFAGWVDPQQTPVYLAAADLALFPHRDSLVNRAKSPSKITAYMAMGKAIVASAVGEAVEYLDGGRAGLLVEPGDAGAFAEGMSTLLRNPARAAELGGRAERRVWERYDWGRQVMRVEQVYRIACGGISSV
jgi:glycosyltransferase involved in cell wall biosynthesis